MINKENAAVLALYVYEEDVAKINRPLIPVGWVELSNPLPATDGFAYGVFRNATTNEVVISYRGTDGLKGMMGADGANNIGLTLGQATSQAIQAAKVYAKVLELYGSDASGSNISFTGHSLGGGLAGMMAVWFARPAFVFDPAPFQAVVESLDAKNAVWTALGGTAPQAFRDFVPAADLASREAAIQRHYATGEFIDVLLSNPGNTLYGSSVAYTFGNQNGEVGMGALHSQALLAAGILSPSFVAATVAVPRALPLIMSQSFYSKEPAGSADRNFLIDLIRSEQQTPNNSKLDHFAADLNKLGTNIAGLNDAAQKALIAQGIEWYYWQGASTNTTYTGQEFFTQSGSVLQYEVVPAATLPNKTSKALPWVKAWLDGVVGSVQGNTLLVATPDYTRFEQWNVATGTTATAATARDNTKTQIFVGGSGADTFTGASAADLLFGGAGADTLQGGSGADTYAFGAAWGKDLVADSDGLGRIRLDGIELQGLFTGTVNGYALDLGAGQYAGLAVVRDSASTTGYKAVIVKGIDTANTITIRDFDLARAQGGDGYLGIRLDGARKLALQGEAGANPFADLGFSPDSLAGQASTLAEGSGKTFTVFLSLPAHAGDTLTLALDDALGGFFNAILGDSTVPADGAVITLKEGQTQVSFALVSEGEVTADLNGALSVSYQGADQGATSNAWGLNLTDAGASTLSFTGDQRAPLDANGRYQWGQTTWAANGTLVGGVAQANFADVIDGTGGNDELLGLGGNDALDGGAGGDRIDGGAGGDRIDGGDGDDLIGGGAGSDSILGGAGNDEILSAHDLEAPQRRRPDEQWTPPAGTTAWISAPTWGVYSDSPGHYTVYGGGPVSPVDDDADVVDGGAGNDVLWINSNSIAARGHLTGFTWLFGIKFGVFGASKQCRRGRIDRCAAATKTCRTPVKSNRGTASFSCKGVENHQADSPKRHETQEAGPRAEQGQDSRSNRIGAHSEGIGAKT